MKASGREFEIVSHTTSSSTIRFRGERETYEIPDLDLSANADEIAAFHDPEEKRA
jgi:hypothetical protein